MLLDKIQLDLKEALKRKESLKVSTLRFLLAEIHNREMQKLKPLTDEEVVASLRQQVKMRQESIAAYQKGERNDLVDREKEEMAILSKYLPQGIERGELEKIIRKAIKQTRARGLKDFGKVMGIVMGKVKDKADGQQVAAQVKELL